jgi:hypothetical protein
MSLVLVSLAFLVSNAARGLASGLAGGLALAATTVVYALSEITGLDSLNSLHDNFLLIEISLTDVLYHRCRFLSIGCEKKQHK